MSGDFCSQNTEVITERNYQDMYLNPSAQSQGRTSCLPNGGSGFSNTGVISNNDINAYVVSTLLPNSGALPPTAPAQIELNTVALDASIQNEYCFYYKRYMYALSNMLTLAATPRTRLNTGSPYHTYKQNAIRLNNLLHQILQVIQGISRYYERSSDINLNLDSARSSLQDHMRKLKDTDMEENVKSAMIDYTIEKNSSSRNLLAIYGFMNIVAVGMLVYLYRLN
jgi:hypothetical protein